MITEHASIATVPGWARRLFENVSPFPELMCSTELYEDGDGFAFGAHFRPCAIGYLSWLSHPTVERAAFVTKEAKNRFLSGFFLPFRAHLPEYVVGDYDAVIDTPYIQDRWYGFETSIRCVLFDVYRVSAFGMPVRLEIAADPYRFDPCTEAIRDNRIVSRRSVQVTVFDRGVRATLDRPIVFCHQRYSRRSSKFFSEITGATTSGYLNPENTCFDESQLCLRLYNGVYNWRINGMFHGGFVVIRLMNPIRILWGFYRSFMNPGELSEFAIFMEPVAASIIQRAWRAASCNPHNTIGAKILRARFAAFSDSL